jgi:integrase
MGHRKGMIYAAIERFDQLMAIGESRHAAKQAIRRATKEQPWTLPTSKIHSHVTRNVYQQHTLAFLNWARTQYGLTRLEQVDARADDLVSHYLTEQLAAGKSAYTVQAQRSALRKFFGNRELATSVIIPPRSRNRITRSRGAISANRHFQPAHWPEQVAFAQATGLRRSELRDLRIRDVSRREDGQLSVHVKNGKGGRARDVPVLSAYEQEILAIIAGRPSDERIFTSIPKQMPVHTYRRASAQERYLEHASGYTLPPTSGRLGSQDYDHEAVQEVSRCLGHQRKSIVLHHYLI